MNKVILRMLCLAMLAFAAHEAQAQAAPLARTDQSTPSLQVVAQPFPKKTKVTHAPNAVKPALTQEIQTIQQQLKALYGIAEAKRTVSVKQRIARLETDLKLKQAALKKTTTAADQQ